LETESIVNALWNAIERLEQRVGLYTDTAPSTISGALAYYESFLKDSLVPTIKYDLPITGNTFEFPTPPIKVGDAYVLNGEVEITREAHQGYNVVEYWKGIEVSNGTLGTLIDAGTEFDGCTLTVNYYSRFEMKYYAPKISNGEFTFIKDAESPFMHVFHDTLDGNNYRLEVDFKGRFVIVKTQEEPDDRYFYTDLVTGVAREVILRDKSPIII